MFYVSPISPYYPSGEDGGVEGEDEVDRGAAMLAVVLGVYEGGKDLIPGWKLKEQLHGDLPGAAR
jgi:hypothetical protein